MKQSMFVSVASAAVVAAHGIVSDLKIGSAFYGGYNPYQDKYMNPVPERIVWAFPDAGNGPVEDVSSSDITCNKGATAASISASVNAGEDVTFYWTEWPESHKGPVMTYMANCGGDCSSADATSLSFFKIDHEGYDGTTWASDNLIANNNSWTVTVPSDIAAGSYLIRHEILALHSAGNANGAQFYPMCANLEVSGSGSAEPEGVNFPGAYTAEDAGILVSIYNGLTTYEIPGPDVYGSSGSSTSTGNSANSGSSSTGADSEASIPTAVGTAPESEAEVDTPALTSAIDNIPDIAISAIAGIIPTSVSAPEPEVSAEVEPTGAAAVPNLPSINIPNFSSVPTAPAEIEAPVAVGPIAETAAIAVPTFASVDGGAFGGFPTAAAEATTMVTSTRVGAVETGAAGVGIGSDSGASSGSADSGAGSASSGSVSINQCLDEVNACIASMQSKTGGAVDFSSCEAKRANCQ